MRTYTDNEVLTRVSELDTFKGFSTGVFDVWIRSKADLYDRFDDKCFTYFCAGPGKQPLFIMSRTGTTNAGSFGLKNWRTYNRSGCAVLKSDTIVYGSHRFGLHKGKPAYVQNPQSPFPYFRDNNSNDQAEEYGEIYTDIIGANVHRAGAFSTVIYNWSIGCLVTNELNQFTKWLAYMRSVGYPPLSVAILKEL